MAATALAEMRFIRDELGGSVRSVRWVMPQPDGTVHVDPEAYSQLLEEAGYRNA